MLLNSRGQTALIRIKKHHLKLFLFANSAMARVKNEMTGRLLHCMLILAGVLLYCNGEYCQLQYSTLQTCDIISGTLLTTHAATRSIFDCVRKCNDITCHSAVYNIISSKCRTYSDIGWGLTTGCPETVIIAYLDSVGIFLIFMKKEFYFYIILS